MTLAEKQQQLIDDLLFIEDTHERLTAIVERTKSRRAVAPEERVDAHRVPGCVSLVWVIGEVRDRRCWFRSDADSPVVRGLVALLCDLYSDFPADEITGCEPVLLERLDLLRTLSPTRVNGLRSVQACIRQFAADQMSSRSTGQPG